MNQAITLQKTNNNLTVTLPQIITDARRLGRTGYSVYDGQVWRYYAVADLDEAQREELEDWLEEVA